MATRLMGNALRQAVQWPEAGRAGEIVAVCDTG
jgi:hypothetical protein